MLSCASVKNYYNRFDISRSYFKQRLTELSKSLVLWANSYGREHLLLFARKSVDQSTQKFIICAVLQRLSSILMKKHTNHEVPST
jgi:hypothetical protein